MKGVGLLELLLQLFSQVARMKYPLGTVLHSFSCNVIIGKIERKKKIFRNVYVCGVVGLVKVMF